MLIVEVNTYFSSYWATKSLKPHLHSQQRKETGRGSIIRHVEVHRGSSLLIAHLNVPLVAMVLWFTVALEEASNELHFVKTGNKRVQTLPMRQRLHYVHMSLSPHPLQLKKKWAETLQGGAEFVSLCGIAFSSVSALTNCC